MRDIINDIARIQEWMIAHPISQAIWFIDRESVYHRLRQAIPLSSFSTYRVGARLGGMPVHCWGLDEVRGRIANLFDEGWSIEQIRRVFPFCQPGIWVQMSDGKHQHIEIC